MAPSLAASTLGPLAPRLLTTANDHRIQQLRLAALSAMAAIAEAAAPPPSPVAAGDGGSGAAAMEVDAGSGGAAGVCGWSEEDRVGLLPGLLSGLGQLAEEDKAAAVAAAALGVKAALQPWVAAGAKEGGAAS